MKKLLTILTLLSTFTLLWAGNVITYTADAKLNEVAEADVSGLYIHAFDVDIVSHTFVDGVGTITFSSDVTRIGDDAFHGCIGLTSVTIPESVTSIRQHAFSFTGLTSITIPSCVKTIEYYAFGGCDSLSYVTIPNSVTSISNEAFASCANLASIIVESDNTIYDSRNSCNAIIETATNTLVLGCKNTIIPSSVTRIGQCAFNGSRLTTITIPSSVTSIGNSAFYGCSSMTSITLPIGVTNIGNSAFSNCSSLTSITIPNSVTSIGEYAFYWCSNLTSIIVESGNTVYDSRNNCNALIESATNILLVGCRNTVIPNSVKHIGESAFYNCFGLMSIIIPNSVKSIGESAFRGCENLTSINIPSSVTSIGDYAFYFCNGLTSMTIGNSMLSLGKEAVAWCSNLFYIVSLTENPPIVGTDCFRKVNTRIPIYVPAASIPLYKAAEQWNEFDIQPILVGIDPIAPDSTNLTWNPIDSASLYKLHLYTDSTSRVVLDTTLNIPASGGAASVQRVHHVALDDIGSVVIITIDPASGTSADNPYLVTVSTTSGERIEVHYDMTVFKGTKVICEDAGSFVLNDAILDAIENIYAPSFPSGIYDLHGRRYSMAVWESLPAGVYILKKDNRVVKVMK